MIRLYFSTQAYQGNKKSVKINQAFKLLVTKRKCSEKCSFSSQMALTLIYIQEKAELCSYMLLRKKECADVHEI